MSKMSEDLTEAIKHREEAAGQLLGQHLTGGLDGEYPGWTVFQEWSKYKIKNLLSVSRLHFNGADPWETAEQALMQTAEHMNNRLYEFLARAMAAGMCIGFNRDSDETQFDWGLIFRDKEWAKALMGYRNQILSDQDTVNLVAEKFSNAVTHFSQLMKFADHTGKETCHVWDLWTAALGATSVSFFVTGAEVGKKWKEEEILEGIMKATNGFPE